MECKTWFAFVFLLSVVSCNQYSDADLKELFHRDSVLCHEEGSWTFNETSVSIDKYNISNFLAPSSKSSCIASKSLSLFGGGKLQVKIYAKSITDEDYLKVLVYDSKDNSVISQANLSKEENTDKDGWRDLIVNLGGVGHYDGYIMLIGKSSDSSILVGSISNSPADEEKLLSAASYNQAPDIYSLQTGSALLYKIHAIENTEKQVETDVVKIQNRSFWIFDTEDFWTPLTISLAVIIPLLILALISLVCFALGKRTGAKQESTIVFEDIDNLPKPYLVPRVKNVYAESVTSSTYAGRNNNVFSV